MPETKFSNLLLRQLKKHGLSETELPQDLNAWKEFIAKINKTYNEYDQARISSDNVLAVSLKEMEILQAEKAKLNADVLKELNENLSLVLQASDLGVWDWNLDTNAVNYDKRWCEIIGYEQKELEHNLETFMKLVHPDDIERVLTLADNYIKGLSPKFDVRFQMQHKHGEWVHIHAKGKIIKFDDTGRPKRFMGTHNDLTEEIRNQKEIEHHKSKLFHQSKLASLGEMSAGIAHEVNNPLAIIAGSAELLAKFIDRPDKFHAKIDSILRSCARISKILNGLKKFSRSAEKNEFKLIDLSQIIDEAVVLTEMKSTRASTPVMKDCRGNLKILCDDLGLEQVLINLINNGIDAVKNNEERWIKVTAHNDNEMVILRVIDSGPAIPHELEEKIFDPFFTTKTVGEGTGLGLSITRGILDEHHATIALNRHFPTTCFEIKFLSPKDNNGA